MRKFLFFYVIGMLLCCGGCLAPMSSEAKIEAEYDLKAHKPVRMLILVEQPSGRGGEANILLYFTESLQKAFAKKIGIKPEAFVSYEELAKLRSSRSEFYKLSPVEIGKAVGADLVLRVVIENFELYALSDTGYHSGKLKAGLQLYDTDSSKLLWPQRFRFANVAIEAEQGSKDFVAKRLAEAAARCTVRYFYTCSPNEYRVTEEVITGFENW